MMMMMMMMLKTTPMMMLWPVGLVALHEWDIFRRTPATITGVESGLFYLSYLSVFNLTFSGSFDKVLQMNNPDTRHEQPNKMEWLKDHFTFKCI